MCPKYLVSKFLKSSFFFCTACYHSYQWNEWMRIFNFYVKCDIYFQRIKVSWERIGKIIDNIWQVVLAIKNINCEIRYFDPHVAVTFLLPFETFSRLGVKNLIVTLKALHTLLNIPMHYFSLETVHFADFQPLYDLILFLNC